MGKNKTEHDINLGVQNHVAPLAAFMAAVTAFLINLDLENGFNPFIAALLAGAVAYGLGYISRGTAVVIIIINAFLLLGLFAGTGGA